MTIISEVKKLTNSDEYVKIQGLVEKIDACQEIETADLRPVFRFFFEVIGKTNPKKKVLTSIPLNEKTEIGTIVLHRFGLYSLRDGYQRAMPLDVRDIFNLIKHNDIETLNAIAEEITYKETRKTFRKYCLLVKEFITENNIENMENPLGGRVEVEKSVVIPIFEPDTMKESVIKMMRVGERYEEVNVSLKNREGYEVSEITLDKDNINIEKLIIIEQIADKLIEALTELHGKVKEKYKDRVTPFTKKLKKEFEAVVIANAI